MAADVLPSVITGLSIITAVAVTGIVAPLVTHREPRARPANDNRRHDLTTLTLMAFGPSLLVAIVVVAGWLVATWP